MSEKMFAYTISTGSTPEVLKKNFRKWCLDSSFNSMVINLPTSSDMRRYQIIKPTVCSPNAPLRTSCKLSRENDLRSHKMPLQYPEWTASLV